MAYNNNMKHKKVAILAMAMLMLMLVCNGTQAQSTLADSIQQAVLKQLNLEIADDKSLGKGFCIGHSYLCNLEKSGLDDYLKNVVTFDILPMLAEYWFDESDKYERWAMELMDVFK